MEKVSLPKGTRDFGPAQMAKRLFIIDSIKKVFQKYGFQPLETPAMENLSTLTGKYGDEGDQLIFKIINSGEFDIIQKVLPEIANKLALGLKGWLRNLCDVVFTELDDGETRNLDKIKKLISTKDEILYFGLYLAHDEKQLLREIVNEKNNAFIIWLIDFFNKAGLYKANYNNDIDFRFKQFESNAIIPHYNRVLFNIIFNSEERSEVDVLKQAFDTILNYKILSLTSKDIIRETSEKGLRYDLTVPFARYVVMNRHEITFPFKRYQIQPVWRADRPQRGRYREFYQCDADVVGTDSLLCETEIILMIKEAFASLGISDYAIKINHRAILSGLAEIVGASQNETALFVAIDKLDKIGEEKVKEELKTKGFADSSLALLFEVLNFEGTTAEKVDFLTQKFSSSEKGKKGLSDFAEVLSLLKKFGATDERVEFDVSLARGLSYYTGCIFEVKINHVGVGSVSGGGRYDNLTAVFDSKEKSSGVGFSFGIDRLYDAMEELKLFPKEASAASTVLVAHLDEESFTYGLKIAQSLRDRNVACEIYPDQLKIKKQLEYADKKKIPFVIVIGSEEVKTGMLTLKKLESGQQLKLTFQEIADAMQLYK